MQTQSMTYPQKIVLTFLAILVAVPIVIGSYWLLYQFVAVAGS